MVYVADFVYLYRFLVKVNMEKLMSVSDSCIVRTWLFCFALDA